MKIIVRFFLHLWAKILIGPGYLYLFLEKYGHHLSNKPLTRELKNGKKIICDLSDEVQQQIYFFAAYEPIESYILTSLINEDSIVIDAGANIGFYTLMMSSHVGVKGEVHSFEPVKETFLKLSKNIDLSDGVDRITLNNKGLWHKDETLTFSLRPDMTNNIGSYSAGSIENKVNTVECEVITLDDYILKNNIERLDIIKIDIEGAELRAFEGAKKSIEKFRPLILMEVLASACEQFGYSSSDICDFFTDLDYKFFELATTFEKSGFITSFEHIDQSNVIAIPGETPDILKTAWDYKKIKSYYLS
jgi:FkbM family methyltransferase